jgi:hypothetical protein
MRDSFYDAEEFELDDDGLARPFAFLFVFAFAHVLPSGLRFAFAFVLTSAHACAPAGGQQQRGVQRGGGRRRVLPAAAQHLRRHAA